MGNRSLEAKINSKYYADKIRSVRTLLSAKWHDWVNKGKCGFMLLLKSNVSSAASLSNLLHIEKTSGIITVIPG